MNSKHMLLSQANATFREGKYLAALYLYQQLLEASPGLSNSLQFNIDLCKRRLAQSERESVAAVHLSEVSLDALISLLDCPLDDLLGAGLPEWRFIYSLYESISTNHPNEEMLLAVLMCARSSPFQRDLLWYASAVMKKLRVLPSELLSRAESVEITLRDLIDMASQPAAWLRLRSAYGRWLGKNGIIDPRAWDLLVRCPNKLGESHMHLPDYKAPLAQEYSWLKQAPYKVKQHPPLAFTLATILLNERKFIGLNLMQHYDVCAEWVLIEGACQGYPPRKVSQQGLSLDNCAAQIRLFPDPKGKIRFVQHGWTRLDGEDAKSEMRNRYLEKLSTDLLVVLDADEFYLAEDLQLAVDQFEDPALFGLTLPQVHFWKGTSHFITGEYFDISHTRIYRNIPGMRYIRNHNFPEVGGKFVHEYGQKKLPRTIYEVSEGLYAYKEPCCYHMGFAKDYDDMRDKTDYYVNRGEMVTRKSTSLSRAAWFDDNLPEKCRVRQWGGGMPEVLLGRNGEKQ